MPVGVHLSIAFGEGERGNRMSDKLGEKRLIPFRMESHAH